VQALANMLVEVCKNPKSPGFNHYLFESVAALIKHGTAGQPQQIKQYEATLFPAFDIVLKNDVQVRLLVLCGLALGCVPVKHCSQLCEAV
jgi:exportin-2 (importin alpha re-exporter)